MNDSEDDPFVTLSGDQMSSLSSTISSLKNEFQENSVKEQAAQKDEIRRAIGEVPEAIVDWALDLCNGDEKETIRRIQGEPGFFQALKDKFEGSNEVNLADWRVTHFEEVAVAEDDSDSDVVIEHRAHSRPKKTAHRSRPLKAEAHRSKREESPPASKRDPNLPRLTLNEAMTKLEKMTSPKTGKEKEGKSSSPLTSVLSEALTEGPEGPGYLNKDKNPNAYYYRFLDVGCTQATGEWTKEEKRIFFQNVKTIGVDYQWGLFSRNIPNRVGYQCSNYYRAMILKGEITDDNYYKDQKGGLHFRFKGQMDGISLPQAPPPRQTMKIRRPRRRLSDSDDSSASGEGSESDNEGEGEGDSVEEEGEARATESSSAVPGSAAPAVAAAAVGDVVVAPEGEERGVGAAGTLTSEDAALLPSIAHVDNLEELLPGLKDPITLKPMKYPALSPYGHVMEYDSWMKVLEKDPKNTCPFTKKKLTRRMLIKLNEDNIEAYRSMIVMM